MPKCKLVITIELDYTYEDRDVLESLSYLDENDPDRGTEVDEEVLEEYFSYSITAEDAEIGTVIEGSDGAAISFTVTKIA